MKLGFQLFSIFFASLSVVTMFMGEPDRGNIFLIIGLLCSIKAGLS